MFWGQLRLIFLGLFQPYSLESPRRHCDTPEFMLLPHSRNRLQIKHRSQETLLRKEENDVPLMEIDISKGFSALVLAWRPEEEEGCSSSE